MSECDIFCCRFKDNVRVKETERMRIVSDEKGISRLVIKNLEKSDLSLYSCTAQNRAGQAKSAATLNASGRQSLTSKSRFIYS